MWWQGKRDLTSLGILSKIQIDSDTGKYLSLGSLDRQRILKLFLVCMILCNFFAGPIRTTYAIAPAVVVPAAVGTFVGVVAIGAVAMDAMGWHEESERSMAFAQAAWDASTKATKDAVMASYNAAVAAGSATMTLSTDVTNWLSGLMVDALVESHPNPAGALTAYSPDFYQVSGSTDPYNATYRISPRYGYLSSYLGAIAYAQVSFTGSGNQSVSYIYAVGKDGVTAVQRVGGSTINMASATWLPPIDSNAQAIFNMIYPKLGAPPYIPNAKYNDLAAKKQTMQDNIPRAIPVPRGQDFIYTPKALPGTDVYMRDDGTLADTAGKVYAPDQVQVKTAPRVKPVTQADGTIVPAVPIGAVGVGSAAIPGTLVNVRTGEAVKTDTGTANPPLDWASQPTTSINWLPLKTAAGAFTKKFPFSIPWDVGRQLSIFDVAPKTPIFKVDHQIPVMGYTMNLKFDINFSFFDPLSPIVGWFLIIAADIGMMLGLRRLMPE